MIEKKEKSLKIYGVSYDLKRRITIKRYAVIDVESTIFQSGSPYSARNRLCLVGLRIDGHNFIYDVGYSDRPYVDALAEIRTKLSTVSIIVVFNGKFDLGWLKRYGIDVSDKEIWDCQLCEFLLSNQSVPYPSLDGTLEKYNLPRKSDIVEREYWSVGVDTPNVPLGILTQYLETDLEIEDALYQWQVSHLPESKRALLKLQNQDLLVLLDMEYNGILFDLGAMAEESKNVQSKMQEIEAQLREYTNQFPGFNFDSGDHLSCLLYGGTVSVDVGHPYETVVKSGPRKGETVTRHRWETVTKTYPRRVTPIEKSELKKAGYFSTDEPTLKQLNADKETKKLIELLLQRSEMEKYNGTYLLGIPKHAEKYDWQDGLIHGTFNQCRVITGRLSSEKPNQQNFPDAIMKFIISRIGTAGI